MHSLGCVAMERRKRASMPRGERESFNAWRKKENFNVRERKRASMLGKETKQWSGREIKVW